jgi:hypothetical protein
VCTLLPAILHPFTVPVPLSLHYCHPRDIIARSNFITTSDKNEMSKIEEVQRALDRLDQAICRLSKTLLILQSAKEVVAA